MPSSEAIQSKQLEVRSAVVIALLSGILTLAGVMSTGLMDWLSKNQIAEATKEQACIARVDALELSLRSKADAYLTSLGVLIASSDRQTLKSDEIDARFDETMRNAYSFSAYAPEHLALLTTNLVSYLHSALYKKNSDQTTSANNYFKHRIEWNSNFQKFINELDENRKKCSTKSQPSQTPAAPASSSAPGSRA